MSATKFSPAPWHACAGDDCPELANNGSKRIYFPHVHLGEPDHERTYVGGDGQTYPALSQYIVINSSGTLERCDADAFLIAASPAMYNVLSGLLPLIESLGPRSATTAAEIRSVLRAARGRFIPEIQK